MQNEDESDYFSNFPNCTAKIRVHSGCSIICCKFFRSIITWNKAFIVIVSEAVDDEPTPSNHPEPSDHDDHCLSTTTPVSPVNHGILEESSSRSQFYAIESAAAS